MHLDHLINVLKLLWKLSKCIYVSYLDFLSFTIHFACVFKNFNDFQHEWMFCYHQALYSKMLNHQLLRVSKICIWSFDFKEEFELEKGKRTKKCSWGKKVLTQCDEIIRDAIIFSRRSIDSEERLSRSFLLVVDHFVTAEGKNCFTNLGLTKCLFSRPSR